MKSLESDVDMSKRNQKYLNLMLKDHFNDEPHSEYIRSVSQVKMPLAIIPLYEQNINSVNQDIPPISALFNHPVNHAEFKSNYYLNPGHEQVHQTVHEIENGIGSFQVPDIILMRRDHILNKTHPIQTRDLIKLDYKKYSKQY